MLRFRVVRLLFDSRLERVTPPEERTKRTDGPTDRARSGRARARRPLWIEGRTERTGALRQRNPSGPDYADSPAHPADPRELQLVRRRATNRAGVRRGSAARCRAQDYRHRCARRGARALYQRAKPRRHPAAEWTDG